MYEEYKIWILLHDFLYHPIISSFLGQNVLFVTLYLYIPIMWSSCGVRDQVSHSYKIAHKIVFLYILI
jgi:hypothetical protein